MPRPVTRFLFIFVACLLGAGFVHAEPEHLFDEGKPLTLPVALPPGPSTWLLGQPYGNTVGAFYNGSRWYEAGQGLHFGLDFSMPCGTPLVAMADGEVMYADDRGFGSGPHNLILKHESLGITALYGHLLQPPDVSPGQWVERGQVIALSGDPDETCDSRPHLHLEIRSLDYRTAYNPIHYINAPWHTLMTIGSYSAQTFERDLTNARQWLTLVDQPDVAFGGRRLNGYASPWPAYDQPPPNPPLPRALGPLPPDSSWRLRRLGYEGCCFWPWWHPTDGDLLYTIDGLPGEHADIYQWRLDGSGDVTVVNPAPPPFASPDGTHTVRVESGQTHIRRLLDGMTWTVDTEGELPAFSTDNQYLMWHVRRGDSTPGGEQPLLETWVSRLDGQNTRQIAAQRGGYALWLDESRVLLIASENQVSTLTVYDVTDDSTTTLGSWRRLRGLSPAPGGDRVMFYLAYQDAESENGVYALETREGAAAQKLPWFGSWRWRDADSVFYLPFDPATNIHALAYYDLASGENRALTDPGTQAFTVANGDWSVSPDGRRVVFLNANDMRMWLIDSANP